MPIKLSGVLHNYQPFRDIWDVTYISPERRFNNGSIRRNLIPSPDGSQVKDWTLDIVTPECYEICAKPVHGEPSIYASIPFNYGPTLLRDLWVHRKEVYRNIVESEKRSFDRFHGHSNALAQASPNHAIVPLVGDDKLTHILWGINEYQTHFERFPEGIWLPEQASNNETLNILADLGIKYVVLPSKSACQIREIGKGDDGWQDVNEWSIDPSRPYKFFSDHATDLAIFFYDRQLSYDLAFPPENSWYYQNSEGFLHRWLGANGEFKHFAVDGETFGHHQKGKADLLAGVTYLINKNPENWRGAQFVNYGLFLEENPPQMEVKTHDNLAWSCYHNLVRWGEERIITREENGSTWKGQLGCECGGGSHEWRIPMKRAMDHLQERIDEIYLAYAGKYLENPEKALEEYSKVASGSQSFYEWFASRGRKGLSHKEIKEAYMLLEMQKFKLYMFTSCGWFHDRVGRIEPFTNFLCANSAVRLFKYFRPKSKIEEDFLAILTKDTRFALDLFTAHLQAKQLNERYLQEHSQLAA